MKTVLQLLGLGLWIALIGTACSTKKNTLVTRTYHNVTAKYNIYFNGNESFRAGIARINDAYRDDYNDRLQIFRYSDHELNKTASSEMDKAITKSTKVIKQHSITKKPSRKKGQVLTDRQKEFYKKNEFCRWIDDSYLLIGKSNFYKGEYQLAINTFQQIIQQFPTENSKYEAMLWLLRTYIEAGRFTDAENFLEVIRSERQFPKKLEKDLFLLQADYFIKSEQYNSAIQKLEEAIELHRKKRKKARYNYILAQLHLQQGDRDMANNLFEKVIKLNPPYEMAFNAQINRALSYSNSVDSEELKSELHKMLKDDKNLDFRDQIYYALANIEFQENNLEQAIEYYKQSAQSSIDNDNQKALSYLALADIYFKEPNYEFAGLYYDSTMNHLSSNFSNYQQIRKKTDNLSALIENLQTVYLQDSLQRLATMTEKERLKIVDNLINEVLEAERREKEAEMDAYLDPNYERNATQNPNTSGKWYFYNPNSISIGQAEFKKRWGNRKLEDNWRRKNKAIVNQAAMSETDETTAESDTTGPKYTNKQREYYLQNVPLTDSMIQVSNDLIKKSLYNAAEIYYEKIEAINEAIERYEELVRRFPDSELAARSLYALHQISQKQNKTTEANRYKNQLVNNYPNTVYARILSDPDYLKRLREEQEQVNKLYVQTYDTYKNQAYYQTLALADQGLEQFPDHKLRPRFSLLKALATGGSGDIASFVAQLEDVSQQYPQHEVGQRARAILAGLMKTDEQPEDDSQQRELAQLARAEKLYQYAPAEKHRIVAVVAGKNPPAKRVSYELTATAIEHFTQDEITISEDNTWENVQVMMSSDFDKLAQVKAYYKQLTQNNNLSVWNTSNPDFYLFIISEKNYQTLLKDKDANIYSKFFKKYYL